VKRRQKKATTTAYYGELSGQILRKQLRFPDIAVRTRRTPFLRGVWPSTMYNDHAL
jgi:hypothetical protein